MKLTEYIANLIDTHLEAVPYRVNDKMINDLAAWAGRNGFSHTADTWTVKLTGKKPTVRA